MPGTYKLFTAIVALIGNISLISTGEVNPAFSLIGTGLLWGYYRSLKGYPSLPKWAVGGLSLTTFVVFLINFYINGDVFLSVAHMSLIFQTIKSFDIKDPWDPLQIFFMSLLQLLIASELTNSIYFGIVFVVFLVFIVVSILLGHFVREGQTVFRPFSGPIALITLLTLVLTVVFFVSIPRLRSSLWGKSFSKSIKTTGFSDRVDFGSFGEVKLDETVVMRMLIKPDLEGPHYLRGMTFDYFNGIAWYDTIKDTQRIFRTSGDFHINVPAEARKYEAEIYLEPIDSDVIFTFKKPYKIDSVGYFMRRDTTGSFSMKQKVSKRFSYKLYSVDGYYHDNLHIDSYLQFPEEIPSVAQLARDITSGAGDNLEKARRLKDYLTDNYTYSLHTEKPEDGSSAIEYFLFNSKKGYCEHFATAMILMLRSIGIPARLVTGFLSGQKNDFGDYYLLRQSDAHSWVEAFIDNRWVMFDPTPPVVTLQKSVLLLFLDMMRLNWNRYVVGFSSYDQRHMANYLFKYRLTSMKFPFIPDFKFVHAGIALFVLFAVYRIIRRVLIHVKFRGVSAEYAGFMRRVSRYGGEISSSSTTDEVLKEAVQTGRFNLSDIKKFIDSYRVLRFSGKTDKSLLMDFYQISKKLKKRNS